jgi:hypothetical protein
MSTAKISKGYCSTRVARSEAGAGAALASGAGGAGSALWSAPAALGTTLVVNPTHVSISPTALPNGVRTAHRSMRDPGGMRFRNLDSCAATGCGCAQHSYSRRNRAFAVRHSKRSRSRRNRSCSSRYARTADERFLPSTRDTELKLSSALAAKNWPPRAANFIAAHQRR